MSDAIHPMAPHHLPFFITAPGESDMLMMGMVVFLLLTVVGIGLAYFTLHAIPEQMAHRRNKAQFEIVAVLGLLALFTHNHLFWIAALLLAMVTLPDFQSPMDRAAAALERLAGTRNPLAGPAPGTPLPVAEDMRPETPPRVADMPRKEA
ncbi:hypothetical protein LAZ40_23930 [Cereibacter sphaeroides]|uniref:hypothetical protein n=1 Tax=Rhodobacterales TaxID=204455 RepID=UPI000BBEA959|nr:MULTISPECIES: hypothetical protein [Paracoccaceae]MCE6962091.1 hypothetical protein [Cereibacter sphaeroides]MCE6970867.1 hypothetical protein [Cereibacter sphaeroides]MCE6972010.1 hypothetical protein [Cereibacter sphaeroides]